MKINLTEIYKGLKAWRHERGITAESQKEGYLINVMEEFGELAAALRDYERFSKPSYPYPKNKKYAEHGIIDALCDIAIFTINAGADIRDEYKPLSIDTTNTFSDLNCLLLYTSTFDFKKILLNCAVLCEKYGYNFEIAMLETIKEISSRTGSYNEATKKWIKDTSDEARAKWYKANYELARIKK
ncbi:MAG: hypothetical protein SPE49_03115 [Campylobacter sp.]|uniref:hypothetical protein n=1 Tax=Campylobacter sp. TaxID=205 RepID=UPI002A80EB25|nr:hypothetical protein [Campylobacter sp.]MCI7587431.1 hypothetical protein [Campylobacter sp.]MDY5114946.1 hypothetical protein [Campylobacter sp.]